MAIARETLILTHGHESPTERYFIGIWEKDKIKKRFIDYGLYLQVLELLDSSHCCCIDVSSLPVSKLYFDIDCIKCKAGACTGSSSPISQLKCLKNLCAQLTEIIGILIPEHWLTVGVKSGVGCGMHVTVDLYVDFAARHVIVSKMEGADLGYGYICDNPSNVLMPGGRGYDSLLNLKNLTTYNIQLEEAINGASIVVTSEQLNRRDHISVRIQNTSCSSDSIEWVMENNQVGGCVFLSSDSDQILIVSRVMIWERIKSFINLSDPKVAIIRFRNKAIPVKWFNHSTLVVSKAVVSQYQIKDHNSFACTQLAEMRLTRVDRDQDEIINSGCMDTEDVRQYCSIDAFMDDYSNWSLSKSAANPSKMVGFTEPKRYPYSADEIKWMKEFNFDSTGIYISNARRTQLLTCMEAMDLWWRREGMEVAAECVKFIALLRNTDGKKTKKRKLDPAQVSSTKDTITPPSWKELFNLAIKQNSITASISFIVRIARCTPEDACLLTMFVCGQVVRENPQIQFVLVRLATANTQLTNFMLTGYKECDWFYIYLMTQMSMNAMTLFNQLQSIDESLLERHVPLRNLMCKYVLNCSKAGDKIIYFDGERMQMSSHKILKKLALPWLKLPECECAYSYRCNYGIYNPYTRVMEANGPSLLELVWRVFGTPFDLMHPSIALYEYAFNCTLKIPSFIEYLQATTFYHTLVAPLWPVYESYPSTHEYYGKSNNSIEEFAVATFQTLLEDLTVVIQKQNVHSKIFTKHIMQYLNKLPHLRKLFLVMVAMVYTLNSKFNVAFDTPSMLISKLFGTDYWQCIGTKFHCSWNQKDNTVSKESRIDQSSITDDMVEYFLPEESNLEPRLEESTDMCNVALIRRLLNSETNHQEAIKGFQHSIMSQIKDLNMDMEDLIAPIFERPLNVVDKRHIESVSETLECFRQINIGPLFADDAESRLTGIDVSHQDINLFVLLVTSWFIRMGDDHRLNNTPIFEYINSYRKILYTELCSLADELVPHGKITCRTSDDLIPVFEEFDKSTELTTCPEYNNVFNVDTILEYYTAHLTDTERIAEKHKLVQYVSPESKTKIVSALMELIRSANYNMDLFLELIKLLGYCEYLGNPLRIGINLYGASGSGKTSLLGILSKTFNSTMNANLTSKQFKESTTGDNDPNARTIGLNFICHMNEENMVLVSRFKSYIDVGKLVTRDCHATEVIEFPIRAKVVFCTNEPVQVENATDDGFYQRYYPIPLSYTFKDYESGLDRLIRHRVENLIPSLYLGGQLLMNLHTSGRTVNFSEKLEFFSMHFCTPFFFNTLTHPIPKIQTCHVRDDYIKYFSRTNPLKLFSKHAHIEYHHVPISETRLQEILEKWWENNKNRIEHKFGSNSSFSKWLNKIDYFGKYRRNDQYFMRIMFSNSFDVNT
ncbi:unnamed protein product [Parnassius mnemosyne]|uniref:SF3 helicase domain-containing protein n=1 Tax=Parnassius mnemosyne TaxID=213953 RepID=A0AAV1LY63_9NEOP